MRPFSVADVTKSLNAIVVHYVYRQIIESNTPGIPFSG